MCDKLNLGLLSLDKMAKCSRAICCQLVLKQYKCDKNGLLFIESSKIKTLKGEKMVLIYILLYHSKINFFFSHSYFKIITKI